jgi:hypothetical protein
MTAPSLDDLANLAARVVLPPGSTKARTVVRFDRSEKQRVDALKVKLQRRALDKTISRAAVVRVLVRMALDMVDAASAANDNAEGSP